MDASDRVTVRGRPTTWGEVAWLAGLLEGEGCFHWQRCRGTWKRDYPAISLQMTDEDVVRQATEIMGVRYHRMTARPGHRDTYRALVTGWPALDVMKAVLPWMGDRRSEKIAELIEGSVDLKRRDLWHDENGIRYCGRGHALAGDNVGKHGERIACRTCRREDQRRYRARQKETV